MKKKKSESLFKLFFSDKYADKYKFEKTISDWEEKIKYLEERIKRMETEMQVHRVIVRDKVLGAKNIPDVKDARGGVQYDNKIF